MVNDSEGIAADLDAAVEASVAAVKDPWKEGAAPKTPYQFTSLVAAEG